MIKEQGVIIEVDSDFAWVETSIKSTCSSCAAKSNCGTSAVASAVAGKTVVNKVINHLQAKVGDTVEIGIEEDTLISGAFYLYIVPILSALLAAFIGQFYLSRFIDVGEPTVILITFFGGFLGFLLAKWKLNRYADVDLNAKLLEIKYLAPKQLEVEIKEVQ